MASAADWKALVKGTFRGLDRQDMLDLYTVDWQQAQDDLIAEHRTRINAERSGWKRFLRKTNAVLYGLTKRLAPPRRLLFALAFLVILIDPQAQSFPSIDFHVMAFIVMTLLLGMELVDKTQFKNELLLARDVQADLMPKTLPHVPGIELGAYNRIANTVGGDLYDFEPLPDGRLAVLFGDASGHGMTAGLIMAVCAATFRSQIETDPSPETVISKLNRVLCRTGATRTGGPRQYFAGVSLLLSPDGSYTAMVAGHPPILKVDLAGRIRERIGKGSYPVGIKEGVRWTLESGVLEPGETLLLHSDGLADVRNAAGVEFGDARIESVLLRRSGSTAPALVSALSAAFTDFLGRRAPEDDVSVAAIRRTP